MRQRAFEQAILELWAKSNVPITRAQVVYYAGISAEKADAWLASMVRNGLLEFDSTDAGEFVYSVRGVDRAPGGSTTFMRCEHCTQVTLPGPTCTRCGRPPAKTASLGGRLWGTQDALTLVKPAANKWLAANKGPKSLLTGTALGLLGPFGWMYAGAWKETIPAAVAFGLLMSLSLFQFLFIWIALFISPLFAIVGLLYTLAYNRTGERKALLLDDKDPPSLPSARPKGIPSRPGSQR